MTVEDQLRQAIAEHVAAMREPPERWDEIEATAAAVRWAAARRRRRRKVGGLAVLGLAATAAAALIAIPALTSDPGQRVVVSPGSRPASSSIGHPSRTPGGSATSAAAAPAPTAATGGARVSGSGYQPLFPFRSLQEADAWQASNRASGAQSWHLDPGQTSLGFTAFLGYTDVTTAFAVRYDSTGAHVTVGYPDPNGRPVNAAVIHLRRFGAGPGAPWEVVGTDDGPTFSVTAPRYGAPVTSPVTVAGAIVGVDESIRVQVLQLSSTVPLGVSCCNAAGSAPWTATVSFRGATDKVLIVAAATGGHLATVERFAVTGVRTSSGTTPGL